MDGDILEHEETDSSEEEVEEDFADDRLTPEFRAGVKREDVVEMLKLLTSDVKLTPQVPSYRRLGVAEDVQSHKRDCRFLAEVLQSAFYSYSLDVAAEVLEEIIARPYPCDQLIYKAGMFLLESHPQSSAEKMNYFLRHCRCLRYADKKEMALEYLIYCLKKMDYSHLRTFLQDNLSIRKKTVRKSDRIDTILKGYLGVLDYLEWIDCLQAEGGGGGNAQGEGASASVGLSRALTCAARAVDQFREVLEHEGTFDIFVVKYLQIQEHYGELGDAEATLEKYAERNPENLNAHVFLYTFLDKHNRRPEEQLEILQTVCKIDPSNPLVLEYIERIYESDGSASPEVLKLVADFVDFSENKDSSAGWSWFCRLARDAAGSERPELHSFLRDLWKTRRSYWDSYHFRRPCPSGSPDVWVSKAGVLHVLDESDREFPSAVEEQLRTRGEKTLVKLHRKYVGAADVRAKAATDEDDGRKEDG